MSKDAIRYIHGLLEIINPEYIVVGNPNFKKANPYRSIPTSDLERITEEFGEPEVLASFLTKKMPDLLFFDIEGYIKNNPNYPFEDPKRFFKELVIPGFNVLISILGQYGIEYSITQTGRGYHLLTRIPTDKKSLKELDKIECVVEKEIQESHQQIPERSKRKSPIPLEKELLNKKIRRLEHFILLQALQRLKNEYPHPADLSDTSEYGLSYDGTPYQRDLNSGKFAIAGSPYKPKTNISKRRRLPKIDGISLEELLDIRESENLSIEYLKGVVPEIKSASPKALRQLIRDYMNSPLYILHKEIDKVVPDARENWNQGYRNYSGLKNMFPEYSRLFEYLENQYYKPRPEELLKPEFLERFIIDVFNKWGAVTNMQGGLHVIYLLTAIYEDPLINWGKEFRHQSERRRAESWVSMFLGKYLMGIK